MVYSQVWGGCMVTMNRRDPIPIETDSCRYAKDTSMIELTESFYTEEKG